MDSKDDMTAHAALSLGDSSYVDEDYESAIDAYAAALALVRQDQEQDHVLKLRALSHRSAAFARLNRFEAALEDAEAALKIQTTGRGLKKGERELLLMRAGIAKLELKRHGDALATFEAAKQLATLNHGDTAVYEPLIQQCKQQLEHPSGRKKTAAPVPAPSIAAPPPQQRPPTAAPIAAPKYQYYQNDNVMTVAILEPNVIPENLRVDFETKRLTVVLTKASKDFTIVCGTLFDEVVVDRCRVLYKDEKVLIKLRKKDAHEWHELISKVEEPTPPVAAAEDDIPTVDSDKPRAYASDRDWDAIERNLKQQEKQEAPEGEEALNKLFEQIYGKADDDTRRAMVKSFQTSGGTVLSTNWDEVSKKDYEKERTAPKGMEWKTYEGNKLPQTED